MSTRIESVDLATLDAGQLVWVKVSSDGKDDNFYLRVINPTEGDIAFHMVDHPISRVTPPTDGVLVLSEDDQFVVQRMSDNPEEVGQAVYTVQSIHLIDASEVVPNLPGFSVSAEIASANSQGSAPYLTLL